MSVYRVITCDVRWVSDNEVGASFLTRLFDWARRKHHFDWAPVGRHDAYHIHVKYVKHSCVQFQKSATSSSPSGGIDNI